MQMQLYDRLAAAPRAGTVPEEHSDQVARLFLRSIQTHAGEPQRRFVQGQKTLRKWLFRTAIRKVLEISILRHWGLVRENKSRVS